MWRFSFCTVVITALMYGVCAENCPPVVAPLGGTTTFSGVALEGTTVTGICLNGLIMSGASTLTCRNGQWNPPAFGICTAAPGVAGMAPGVGTAQCLPMAQPLGATLLYSSGATSTALAGAQNHGTTVTLRCNAIGSVVSGPSIATCINGQWQPPVLGTCSNAGGLSCLLGVLPPLNGHVIYSSSAPYPEGSLATLVCNPGYIVSGQSMVTCRNGVFGLLGTCISSGGPPTIFG